MALVDSSWPSLKAVLRNATLNFGLVADAEPPFEDVLLEDLPLAYLACYLASL